MKVLLVQTIRGVLIVDSNIIDQRSAEGKNIVKCVDYTITTHMTVEGNLYGTLALKFVLRKCITRVSSIWTNT